MTPLRVAIVGAGITGLTVAYRLREDARARGLALDLAVLEAGPRAGGHVRTMTDDGFIVEAGPNAFLDREPAVGELVRALGLEGQLVEPRPEASRRFIVRGGRLRLVPHSPGTLMKTPALSVRGRLRVLLEPLAPGPPPDLDETVFDFARRRIGREAAQVLVDTAVAGISAGDSRALSVHAQFPLMVEMEQEHGSLFRAMRARRRRGIQAPRLRSFDRGMGVVTDRLQSILADCLRTRAEVVHLSRDRGSWRVGVSDGSSLRADHVVLALPAARAAVLTRDLDSGLSASLTGIPAAGVAVVACAYRASDVPHPLNGYGYLVTRDERLATLGVVWESSLFDGRAPEGTVLLRAMIGGARMPEHATLDRDAAVTLAREELRRVMRITAAPIRSWHVSWPRAIAQYTVGHLERVATIRRLARRHPGLAFCGTSFDGVSFGAAVASGSNLASSLIGNC